MRIATLIISLFLMLIIAFQSCAATVGADMGTNPDLAGAGKVGFLVAFLFLLEAAFAFGVPLLAVIAFVLAGLLALAAGFTSGFTDLQIWGFAAFVLAIMSYLGRREKL